MRIYTREREPDLRSGLLGLLLAALDTEQSEIWLVAPWLRDIALPISDHGHFASVFGGQQDEVRLTDLLARLARRHQIHVVAKPLDELVPLAKVRRIGELLDARDALLANEEARAYETAQGALTALADEIATLGRDVTQHAATVNMLIDLAGRSIAVHVTPHLHAKLLWTPAGAMLGSANFTHGGMTRNEELMVEVSVPGQLAELRVAAEGFAARGTTLARSSIVTALSRVGVRPPAFRAAAIRFADEPALQEAASLLRLLCDHAS